MSELRRHLSTRHLSMIALGGTLGTGIFLTSGSALYIAGPMGAILAYIVMGIMVYLLMNSLGEMSAYKPVSGSFCEYSSEYVSKSFGFMLGYNYWFSWDITIAVELIAAALVMGYWFPNVPTVEWCILFFIGILLLNLLPVKSYGESQYWLSVVKVSAILVFIVVGVLVIFGFNTQHQAMHFHNWNQGHFHNGLSGLFQVFLLSGFAFQGTELIGVAAGEAKDPQKSIPRAVKQIFWRILLFYVVIMLIISIIIPYTDPRLLNPDGTVALSPFTIIFSMTGFHFITSIMNFVILIALLSACNSDMYSATRILWNLSVRGSASKIFSKVNRFGIPIYALLATASFGLLAFLCDLFGSTKLFLMLVNISSLSGFIAWYGIARSHIGFRKHFLAQGNKLDTLPFQSRFYPWGPFVAMALSVVVIAGQWYVLVAQHQLSLSSLLSTYIGLPFVLLMWVGNAWYRNRARSVA